MTVVCAAGNDVVRWYIGIILSVRPYFSEAQLIN